MDKLYILAGTVAQASDYMRKWNLTPSQIVYVASVAQLKGAKNPRFTVTGTFWDRHNAIELWKELCRCVTDGRDMKTWVRSDLLAYLYPPPAPPPPPKIPRNLCLRCGKSKPANETCAECPPPKPVVIGPVEHGFKSIKPPKPPKLPNNGFKSIRK